MNTASKGQLDCLHPVVLECDLGPNNHSVRLCPDCFFKEEVWVDENGFSNGYSVLPGADGRTIRQVKMCEILKNENPQALC